MSLEKYIMGLDKHQIGWWSCFISLYYESIGKQGENIVDIICLELFYIEPRNYFDRSFANSYITANAIKTDLVGAVKKMMADYALMQQKNIKDR
jgi:hypothetical protein